MNLPPWVSHYARILIIGVLVATLGLAPLPHAASRYLAGANEALKAGDALITAVELGAAANYFPWRPELYALAARYALQGGESPLAIHYLKLAGAISPLTSSDLLLLGDAYLESFNSSEAELIWTRLAGDDPTPAVYQRLADLHLEQRNYSSAIQDLRSLLAANPSDTSRYFQLGTLLAVTDPQLALPYLVQAADLDPVNAQKARTLHDKLLTAGLFDQPAYNLLVAGRQLADWGDWTLAALAFQRATSLQPAYAEAWALLGEARQQLSILQAGDRRQAGLLELNRALQLDPGSVLANTLMALHWERLQRYAMAQPYLEQAIKATPQDPFLYSELGSLLAKTGDLPAAQAAYQRATALSPTEPLFFRLLAGFALEHEIQLRELALPAARQALLLNVSDPASLDLMAQVMLALKDYHSAERFAAAAWKAGPGDAQAALHLGMAYVYLEQPYLAKYWLNCTLNAAQGTPTAAFAQRLLAYYFPGR